MKRLNKKGFTMAELLIVVAIIAVLVAIAIPVFTTQLEKARQATDLANLRAAYAEAMTDALDKGADGTATSVAMTHTGTFDKVDEAKVGDVDVSSVSVTKGKTVTVTVDYDADPVTVTFTSN